ncbi:YidC/Oxa1 family membrane protein insertase [Patescibacteria group bacterium]|nr:YidC/Oxa1 family membrane protein insertase [Patescibacteria group bacterium]
MKLFIDTYISSPLLGVLIFIYNNLAFHDLGLSIIMLTVAIRIVLLPFFYKGAKDQTIMQKLQPFIKQIQEKHKNDKGKQAEALMELYKKHKINPFSSMLLLIIQLPIFIALFDLFTNQIKKINLVSPTFLGLFDLTTKNWTVVVLAAILQYFQTKSMLGKQNISGAAGQMQKVMAFVGPLITILILGNLPSAIGLYWLVFTAFSFVQQVYINKSITSINIDSEATKS